MVAAIQSYCDEFDMLFDPDLLKGMHKNVGADSPTRRDER